MDGSITSPSSALRQTGGKAGFTLIELLAVVTIILVLAGITVAGLGYVNEKQAREKAKVQIELLSSALEEYRLDHGHYPRFPNQAAGTGRTNALYRALFWDGANDPSKKIYLADLDPGPASRPSNRQGWIQGSGQSATIIDPWGNEYRYRSGHGPTGSRNSSTVNPDFDLWSVGKSGNFNANPEHPANRDNIGNF